MVTREELMAEGLVQKFIRYIKVDTEGFEQAHEIPSSDGQWKLARMLASELSEIGLSDVEVDDHAFVTGRLPSNLAGRAPAVGFIAHMDTVPGVPGAGVKHVLHRSYDGGDIEVAPGTVLSPRDTPALAKAVGCDIITSDGTTLLGADDKAGVAEIMQALVEMVKDPGHPHPDVWVAFTPDEETGRGIAHFPKNRFEARIAYTLDGGDLGELQLETFNAINGVVIAYGISSHTGTARGKMVNAVHLAAEVIASIPATWRPETTSGREGFIHPNDVEGNVERVRVKVIIRDFDRSGLELRERAFLDTLRG
ncbi:MAG: tripeptide aminopeptidase PepT, partial [Firmicutes bacterium]|nr:tripeptide aminopeptidase PepT [Bacillota bacterium]